MKVIEVKLDNEYNFMYENFLISTQNKLYLLLEKVEDSIKLIEFDFRLYKYGYPNDEIGHPLQKFGLGFYGFYIVENSTWIYEMRNQNSQHPYNTESSFDKLKHFVVKFKDVTLEIIASNHQEKTLTKLEIDEIIDEQFKYLE